MHNFKELIVWQRAMDLVTNVYKLVLSMPDNEKYGLTNQIKRSAVSIPCNIAEGAGKGSDADFARFMDISIGSANELETQLLLAVRLNFLREEQIEQLIEEINSIQKISYSLIKKFRIESNN